jgi:hypothetical protein
MMGAVRTSETSVSSSETTRRYIPEGSHPHTRRCDNPKSHIGLLVAKFVTKERERKKRKGSTEEWIERTKKCKIKKRKKVLL